MSRRTRTAIFILQPMLVFLLLVSACQPSRVKVEYRPLFIPVKLVIDNRGNVSVEGEASLVTPVGVFSIGAEYELKREDDGLLVIIRDQKKGTNGFDTIYRIHSGGDEFVAVVNGTTTIQIMNRQILIDVSDGSVKSIEFKEASAAISEAANAFWKPFPLGYHPFAFTEWAYDDSTIDKWYGLGFLWFCLRLILAAIFAFVDLIIILILGIGVVLHSVFGVTVRNIYFGLLGIIGIGFLVIIGWLWWDSR
jgi:hypothetical protein